MTVLTFCLVGFLEWLIATERTWLITKAEAAKAAGVVFLENLLAFFVLFQFVKNVDNWYIALAYSLGASLGTLFDLKIDLKSFKERFKKKK